MAKRVTVSDCLALYAGTFETITPGAYGWVSWGAGRAGSIGYRIEGGDCPRLSLFYRCIAVKGAVKGCITADLDYLVDLTAIPTPWGALCWYFYCPGCGRRVSALYLPPGAERFTCRHCHDLKYKRSTQGVYRWPASDLPGDKAPADLRYPLGVIPIPWPKPTRLDVDTNLPPSVQLGLVKLDGRRKDHPDYLSVAHLCKRSGLSPDDLVLLEKARLLVPDTASGCYRPKLVGWARKLGILLRAGWTVDELRAWSSGRWSTDNPRAWPPDRAG